MGFRIELFMVGSRFCNFIDIEQMKGNELDSEVSLMYNAIQLGPGISLMFIWLNHIVILYYLILVKLVMHHIFYLALDI